MYPVTPHAPDSGIEDAVVLGVLQGVRQVLALAGAGPDQGGDKTDCKGDTTDCKGDLADCKWEKADCKGDKTDGKGGICTM